jgi:hypothetical protein
VRVRAGAIKEFGQRCKLGGHGPVQLPLRHHRFINGKFGRCHGNDRQRPGSTGNWLHQGLDPPIHNNIYEINDEINKGLTQE